jgi:putative restriction endonuclease
MLLPFISTVAGLSHELVDATQRRYYLQLRTQRAHQAVFRANVLRAYRTRCTVCSLGHVELLDAAHIVSDRDGGEPVIPNGLAMCKIHHAAFDSNIIGVRPDLVAEVRHDILDEHDGPMLLHGIQGIHGRTLVVPRKPQWRPDPVGIERRYEQFRDAS